MYSPYGRGGKHGFSQSLRGVRDTKYHHHRAMEEEYHDNVRSSHYGTSHSQMQSQLQRPKEASKQMLYGVFGNLISILEEFEKRETGRGISLPRSRIHIPDQSHNNNDDVESIVQTQLLLFETQTKACPPEVLSELKDELKRRTVAWAAVREEVGVKGVQKTDMYVTKLYEILAKGSTHHDIPSSSKVSKTVMRDSFSKIMKGDHDKRMLDEAFKSDPSRRALAPDTRASELYSEGARRINRTKGNNDLDHDLQRTVRTYQSSNR